jgi:hypothetical protein
MQKLCKWCNSNPGYNLYKVSYSRFADYYVDLEEAKKKLALMNKIATENNFPIRKLYRTFGELFCSQKCIEEYQSKHYITWFDMSHTLNKDK